MNRNWRTEGAAISLGLGFGVAADWVIFQSPGIGISLGVVFGILLGECWGRRGRRSMTAENAVGDSSRLYRSRGRRMLLGVCGGVSERYGWNITAVRVVAFVATILTGVVAPLAYLLFSVSAPSRPQ